MKTNAFLLLLIVFFSACKSDQDTTLPSIDNVKVNGVQASEHDLEAGTSFSVAVNCSDDQSLNQVKINIHSAADGHAHTGTSTEEPIVNVGVWSLTKVINLEGTSDVASLNITIPDSVAGAWHLEVQLLDESGNEAEEYVSTIHVSNSNLPVISATFSPAPNTDGDVVIAANSSVGLDYTVTDPDGVQSVLITITNESETVTYWTELQDGGLNNPFSFSTVSPALALGHYVMIITATDGDGYVNIVEQHIEVE